MQGVLTVGQLSERYGLPVWTMRRALDAECAATVRRANQCRVILERDLPRLERALQRAGYLQPAEVS